MPYVSIMENTAFTYDPEHVLLAIKKPPFFLLHMEIDKKNTHNSLFWIY